jgi:nitrite reductase/ring-hydroxylating ferredoxin subunit
MALFLKCFKKIVIILFVLANSGCVKEDQHPVPLVPVDFRVNLEFQFIGLNSIGGHENVYGGYGGIVIYRFSVDQFYAFDRACPVHPHDPNARIVVENAPIAHCKVCETNYLLLDGSRVSGPGKFPLRQYRTFYSEPYLYVSHF